MREKRKEKREKRQETRDKRQEKRDKRQETRDKGSLHICHKKNSVWALALKAIRL